MISIINKIILISSLKNRDPEASANYKLDI